MRRAWPRGMHAVSFYLKRAHLQTVRFGQRVVDKIEGMTPARFDLMYLLRRPSIVDRTADPLEIGQSQQGLIQDLGLHPSTVSKMLTRLEQMGWIRRVPEDHDARLKYVMLTALGLRKIWEAMRIVFRSRVIRKRYETHYASVAATMAAGAPVTSLDPELDVPNGPRGEPHVVSLIDRAYRVVRGIANAFGDRSSVWYGFGARRPRRDELTDDTALGPLQDTLRHAQAR